MREEEKEEKSKTLEKIFLNILGFTEENLKNFVINVRFERLKNRQKNIFSMIDFIHYFPDIYQKTADRLSERFPSLPRNKKEIEDLSIKNMDRIFAMFLETRLTASHDVQTTIKELYTLTSFFEAENNMDVEGSSLLVQSLDLLTDKTADYIENKLRESIMDVMDPDSFKKISLYDLKNIQKSINHILDTLGLDPVVEKVFNALVKKEEADSLHVITALGVLNEFLQGHIALQEALDDTLNLSRHEKKLRFEKALHHFKGADKNILDDENSAYLTMSKTEFLKLAQSLDVTDFDMGKRRINLLKPKP